MARPSWLPKSINYKNTTPDPFVVDNLTVNNNATIGNDLITGDLTVISNANFNNATLTFASSTVDFTGAGILFPNNQYIVKRFVSNIITQDVFNSGTTQLVTLTPGVFAPYIPLGGYCITDIETQSSSPNTTGLSIDIGAQGGAAYFVPSTLIFGAAGRKTPLPGGPIAPDLGQLQTSDFTATFTAIGGGSEDLTDITQMSIKIIVYYVDVTSE